MPEVKLNWEGENLTPDDDDQTSNVLLSRQVAHEYHAPAVQAIITAERAAAQVAQETAMSEVEQFQKDQARKKAENTGKTEDFATMMTGRLGERKAKDQSRTHSQPSMAAFPQPDPKGEKLISEATGLSQPQLDKDEKLISEATGQRQAASNKNERLISEETAQKVEGIPKELGGIEDPMIDPVMAASAGAGAAFSLARSSGLKLVTSLAKAVNAGVINAVTDPIYGTAAEVVGANNPALALPFNVLVGIGGGMTFEPMLERAITRASAKIGKAIDPALMRQVLANESGQVGPFEAFGVKSTPKTGGGDMKIGDNINFIRYGKPVKNSTDWSSNKTLPGMSVYGLNDKGAATQTIRGEFADRFDVYIGRGKIVGFGSDGEPLVANYKIRKATKEEDELAYYGKSKAEWRKEHGFDENGNKIIDDLTKAAVVEELNNEIKQLSVADILKSQKGELVVRQGPEAPAPKGSKKSGVPAPPDMKAKADEFLGNKNPDITGELAPGSNIRLRSVSELAPKLLDKIGEGEDLTRVMASMSETFSDQIKESTRGVVSHAQTVLEAQGLKVADVMGRKHATTLNASQTSLLVDITVDSLSALFEMKKVINSSQATPLDTLKFAETFNGTYMAIMQYAGNAAELGRAVDIHKRIKRATGLKVGELKDFVQGLYGKDPEEIAAAMGDMDNLGKLANFIKQSHQATTANMWNEAYINGMLWLPTTHMANMTSNTLTDVMSVGERYVAAGISQSPIGSGQITFNEAQDYAYGMMQATKDAWRIFAQALATGKSSDYMNKIELSSVGEKSITGDNVAAALTRGRNRLGKMAGRDLEKTVPPIEFEQGSPLKTFIDVVGDLTRVPGRVLMAEDEAGKWVAYRAELHALSRRKAFAEFSDNVEAANGYLKKAGIDSTGMDDEKIVLTAMSNRIAEIIDDPVKHAADVHIGSQTNARYLTYTSPITNKIVNAIRSSQNPLMKMLVPFTGTPYNIFRYTTERTPLFGFFLRSMREDFEAGGARRDLALAKQAIGTMVWGSAVGMVLASGQDSPVKVYGYGPREPNRRKAWLRDGHKPYSFEFGNVTVEYGRMEPFASVFGIAVDGSEIMGLASEKLAPETDKIFPAWMAATAQGYMSKTFLAGVSQGIQAFYEADANKMQRLINSWGKSAVPFSSALRGVEQLVSPQRKAVDGLLEAIASEIPGLSDKLPLQRDLWGRTMSKEIEKNESYLQMAVRAVSPIYISKRQDSPIDKELYQNFKEGLPMPRREQTFLGQFENSPRNSFIKAIPYELNTKQYEQFQIFMNQEELPSTGMTLKKSLDHMVKNDEQYKSETNKEKKMDMIRSKIREAQKIARAKMYETDADIRSVVDELQTEEMSKR